MDLKGKRLLFLLLPPCNTVHRRRRPWIMNHSSQDTSFLEEPFLPPSLPEALISVKCVKCPTTRKFLPIPARIRASSLNSSNTRQASWTKTLQGQTRRETAKTKTPFWYHFEDITDASATTEILSQEMLPPHLLALEGCSSAWHLTARQQVAKFNEEAKNEVTVYLALLRLPSYGTDVLLTFNDPTWINPLSSSAVQSTEGPPDFPQPPWTVEHFHTFIRSLRLLDPGIFG